MKKTNKIIGVYTDSIDGKVGQTTAYVHYLNQFGYVRLLSVTDNLENIENEIDMLVIPGGLDVDTTLYEEAPSVMNTRTNPFYEYLDKILIPKFVQAKKPIVGICRGMQRLNVYFGGTLIQHISGHQQGSNRKETNQLLYTFNNISQLYEHTYDINSLHHQTVGKLGDDLLVLGYSHSFGDKTSHTFEIKNNKPKHKNDKTFLYEGIIEIIKHEYLPIVGFQYHPEEFNCPLASNIILSLL